MKLSRYKHDSPVSYALGATLSYELIKHQPTTITRVFVRPQKQPGEDIVKIIDTARRASIDIITSNKAFNVLGAKNNCQLIAEFRKSNQKLSPDQPHIVLVNPSDSGNLGSIMRSAVGFGYQNLAVITPAVDHFHPKVIRASMGAFTHLNIQTFADFDSYRVAFPKHPLYLFMLRQATPLPQITTPANSYSLVFGNEAAGLPDNFSTYGQPVFIPQTSKIDSLNLATAASIAMYCFSTLD